MKAVILAGGKGLRLREVIKDIPKPMAPVGGRPFLEYVLGFLLQAQISEIIFSVGYKADVIQDYFQDGRRWGAHIRYCAEEEPLGTGGALKKASSLIDDDEFFAMNGDSLLGLDIEKMKAYHKEKNASATLALTTVNNSSRYGAVTVNDDGSVIGFFEKSKRHQGKINAGVYILKTEIFRKVGSEKASFEEEILPSFIGKGLYAFSVEGFFTDIGTPDDYRTIAANPPLLSNMVTLL